MTIRKFARRILSTEDLIGLGTLDHSTAEFLKACVVSRLNILICGGASSGKTTLLNILGAFIPEGERVITIEDTLELKLPRAHTVPMETRPPNMEGRGEITIRNLLRNTLHMRPDRIIIGEVRSDEVLDMVQSMNTGHEGSMTTLHANSTPEALDRLEVLALMGSVNMSAEVAKRQIITAIDVVINMQRFSDGHRRLTHVSEVVKGKDYCLNDIIVFEEGRFKFSAKAPAFSQVLAAKAGYAFPGA
jgi:pilus assembly protein CpaF